MLDLEIITTFKLIEILNALCILHEKLDIHKDQVKPREKPYASHWKLGIAKNPNKEVLFCMVK